MEEECWEEGGEEGPEGGGEKLRTPEVFVFLCNLTGRDVPSRSGVTGSRVLRHARFFLEGCCDSLLAILELSRG